MLYIGEKYTSNNYAGSKARTDIDQILRKRYGAKSCACDIDNLGSVVKQLIYTLKYNTVKKLRRLYFIKNEYIVMQYPPYFGSLINYVLKHIIPQNKVVLFIHDIDSLRAIGRNSLKNEIGLFNKCTVVIVHNKRMLDKLRSNGLTTQAVCLELFDYLLDNSIPNSEHHISDEIIFAGNLEKSRFLNDNNIGKTGVKFNLYGPNYKPEAHTSSNIAYMGSFGSNDIPYRLQGAFGLVWDGDTIETCNGANGQYTKYNNPHKLSLYISAGVPVVVWNEAAVADFVNEHGIGIVVSRLSEMPNRIKQMKDIEYTKMITNIKALQNRIINGYFSNTALEKCEKLLRG